jgi:hypothetical protein
VPSHSENRRCASDGIQPTAAVVRVAPSIRPISLSLACMLSWSRERRGSAVKMQHPVRILERERHFCRITLSLRRIRNAPMRGHGLTRPHWAGFSRRVITDGKHKIEH